MKQIKYLYRLGIKLLTCQKLYFSKENNQDKTINFHIFFNFANDTTFQNF